MLRYDQVSDTMTFEADNVALASLLVGARCVKDISSVVSVLDTAPPLTSCPTFVPNSTTLNVVFVASKPVPDIVSLLESDERSDVLMSTFGFAATIFATCLVALS